MPKSYTLRRVELSTRVFSANHSKNCHTFASSLTPPNFLQSHDTWPSDQTCVKPSSRKNRYTSATRWAFRAEPVVKWSYGPPINGLGSNFSPTMDRYNPYQLPYKWVFLGLFHRTSSWWFWAHFVVFHVPCSTPHISTGVPLHPKAAKVNPSDWQKQTTKTTTEGKNLEISINFDIFQWDVWFFLGGYVTIPKKQW